MRTHFAVRLEAGGGEGWPQGSGARARAKERSPDRRQPPAPRPIGIASPPTRSARLPRTPRARASAIVSPEPGDARGPVPPFVTSRSPYTRSAGMEDERAHRLALLDAGDRRSLDRRPPGSRSAASTTVTAAPAATPRSIARELTGRRSGERGEQIAVEEREHRLRLGVAESAVELEHARAVLREHQAREEKPDERELRVARARRARGDGSPRRAPRRHSASSPGTGAYDPMPPVFGPSSPSNARLKS